MSIFWTLSIIFCAYAVYRLASRLFPDLIIEQLALTILLWLALQILCLTIVGFVGLLNPLATASLLLLMSLALIWIRPRLSALIPDGTSQIQLEIGKREVFIILMLILLGIAIINSHLIRIGSEATTGVFVDVIQFEIPITVNFYQAQSIWMFEGRFAYYNYGFHLLYVPAMWMTSNYALMPIIHAIPYIGALLYMVLIGDWIVKKESPTIRLVIGLTILILALLIRENDSVLWRVGKNDQFITMVLLGAIYYWMCYWQDSSHDKATYLIFMGIALGAGLSAKFSILYWMAILGVFHLLMMLRSYRPALKNWLLTGISHFLYVGIPVALWSVLWFVRSRLGYAYQAEDLAFFNQGWRNTLISLWNAPLLSASLEQWFPLFLVVIIGFVLSVVLFHHQKFPNPIVLVGLITTILILLIVFTSYIYRVLYHGPGTIAVSLALIVFISYGWKKTIFPYRVIVLSAWVILSGLLFLITPFSAGTGESNLLDPQIIYVSYRYQPSLMSLFIVLMAVVFVLRIASYFQRKTAKAQYRTISLNIRPAWIGTLVLLLLLLTSLIRIASYQPLSTVETETPPDSGVYAWVTDNLHDTSMLAYNKLFPYLLYGDDLSNRVHFWIADFDWSVETVRQYMDEQALAYLIVPQQEEFQAFQEIYTLEFEDDYYMVLSVRRASP